MSDLEPNVRVRKGIWRVAEYAVEAFERFLVLALLFVDDAESKQDFVCLVKVYCIVS